MIDNRNVNEGLVCIDNCAPPITEIENKYIAEKFTVDSDLLVVKTVDDFRNLSDGDILDLVSGGYKGVQLLGYYKEGDTPSPINYYLSEDTSSVDDGGSVFVIKGKIFKHDFTGDIDIRYFGAKGIKTQNVYVIVNNVLNVALEKGNSIYFPSGIYNTFGRNFPFRKSEDDTYEGLRDLKGIIVYGDGEGTIFMTQSEQGADVLQINSVKNFKVKDISATAELTAYNHAGSNGVSITNGFDNVEILDVHCFDLASVAYPDDGYIDGGKAFTFQSSNGNNNLHGRVVIRGTSKNCAYGFEHSGFMDDVYNNINSYNVSLNISIDKCYSGAQISFAEPTAIINDDMKLIYNANFKIKNAQHDFVCHRLFGANINVDINSDETISQLKINPITSDNWLNGSVTRALYVGAFKNGNLYVNGYKKASEYYGQIGAVGSMSEPYYNGGTTYSNILLNVNGNFNTNLTVTTNAENNNVATSSLVLNNISSIPSELFSPTKQNNFIINGVPFFTQSTVNQMYFNSDNTESKSKRFQNNPDGSIDVIGQRVGSANFLSIFRAFGYSDGLDKLFFEVLNGGGFRFLNNVGTDIKLSIGVDLPEGGVEGKSGDIYIRTGDVGGRINGSIWFKVSPSGASGWVNMENTLATESTVGVVKKGVAVPNGSSVDDLLASLRTAGIIST